LWSASSPEGCEAPNPSRDDVDHRHVIRRHRFDVRRAEDDRGVDCDRPFRLDRDLRDEGLAGRNIDNAEDGWPRVDPADSILPGDGSSLTATIQMTGRSRAAGATVKPLPPQAASNPDTVTRPAMHPPTSR
jgi:hypothetical protein